MRLLDLRPSELTVDKEQHNLIGFLYPSRNILCFPICDEENIIGVAQLCNKVRKLSGDLHLYKSPEYSRRMDSTLTNAMRKLQPLSQSIVELV